MFSIPSSWSFFEITPPSTLKDHGHHHQGRRACGPNSDPTYSEYVGLFDINWWLAILVETHTSWISYHRSHFGSRYHKWLATRSPFLFFPYSYNIHNYSLIKAYAYACKVRNLWIITWQKMCTIVPIIFTAHKVKKNCFSCTGHT